MGEYGNPSKLNRMAKAMYEESKWGVVDDSGKFDWFQVRTGLE